MIKKTTKVIFEGGKGPIEGELEGGIPLSKGEVIHIHKGGAVLDYIVKEKKIDCYIKGDDQIISITYVLKKK